MTSATVRKQVTEPQGQQPLPQVPHLNQSQTPHRHRAALHMATTLSALLSLPSVWPSLKNASPSSKPTTPPASQTTSLARLGEISAQHPDLAPHLTREMALRARGFMNGVTLYRNHPAQRPAGTAPILWQSGTTTLRDYAPQAAADAPIVFVVPSLINRFTILDLQPGHSFLHMLVTSGLRPVVVDWDIPGDAEKDFSLGDYVTQRLIPALQSVAFAQLVHIMGYCMGGTLALALANLCPDKTRSLTLLAAPWDFHAGYEAIGQDGWKLEEKLKPWLTTDDVLPVEVVQGVFTAFQPLHAFRKFSAFAALDQSSVEAARFVLTEDWLNDGVPLTAPAARECFGDWSQRNVTAKGQWKVGGKIINSHAITAPAYVVVPGKDRIVPPESAMPLARAIPHAVRHEPMMGHVGIMAGTHAPHQVWKPLVGWLQAH